MGDCLCDRCTALCCRYFALEIDTPTTPEEYDNLRWYLAHEGVHAFIEEEKWYLSIQTKCQYLEADSKCGIYEDRPQICRDYSTDNCDFYVGDYEFEQYFTSPDQIEAYAQQDLGSTMTRYAMSQRKKNTGSKKPDKSEVLDSRRRPPLAVRLLSQYHPAPRKPGPKDESLVSLTVGQAD